VLALAAPARAGETITYSYDALGRLTATSSDSVNNEATSSIGYDAAGNRSIFAASVPGAPAFSVSEAGALEGGRLVFTVIKNGTGAASVTYYTANGSAGSNDYWGVSGVLSFAAGESSKTIALATIDDSLDEPGETISINLNGPSAGATVADAQGIGTIFDNDDPPPPPPPPPPSFSISDASATEGGNLLFTVTKTGAAASVFGVNYASADGTATGGYNGAPDDYYATAGTVYFTASETSKTVTVYGIDDGTDEPNETLALNLSGPTGGATLSDAQGLGTILDNDDPPPPPPPGNTPPTAVNDTGSQKVCTIRTYDVLANDSDPDGNYPLTLIASSNPGFAIVANQIQVSSSDLSGLHSTTYTVRDSGNATATATLTLTITAGTCNQ
jgi:hypothetical protein